MGKNKWHLLRLFGDTGSAADTPSGDMAAAAGQQERADTQPQAAAAETSGRLRWEKIMADPEYNRRMQQTVQSRLKKAGEAQAQLEQLAPALEALRERYGLDPEKPDYTALASAIRAEGKPENRFARHIQMLEVQGAALKGTVPGFDLRRELQNPVFVRLTAPGSGLTVEDAYFAVHRAELQSAAMEAAARVTARKLSNSIQAGSRRPRENGSAAQAASVAAFDYRSATAQQRAELKRQIREAAARGEKLYPR